MKCEIITEFLVKLQFWHFVGLCWRCMWGTSVVRMGSGYHLSENRVQRQALKVPIVLICRVMPAWC